MKIFQEILLFFENINEIFAKINGKKLEDFGNMDLSGVRGRSHPKLAKILKISRKINGNLQNFDDFHEFLANFDLKALS